MIYSLSIADGTDPVRLCRRCSGTSRPLHGVLSLPLVCPQIRREFVSFYEEKVGMWWYNCNGTAKCAEDFRSRSESSELNERHENRAEWIKFLQGLSLEFNNTTFGPWSRQLFWRIQDGSFTEGHTFQGRTGVCLRHCRPVFLGCAPQE
jgi:hypothetical protein